MKIIWWTLLIWMVRSINRQMSSFLQIENTLDKENTDLDRMKQEFQQMMQKSQNPEMNKIYEKLEQMQQNREKPVVQDQDGLKININLKNEKKEVDTKKSGYNQEQIQELLNFVDVMLKQNINMKKDRIKELEQESKDMEMQYYKQNSRIDQLQEQKQSMNNKNQETKDEIKNIKQSITRQESKVIKLKEENQKTKDYINEVQAEILKLSDHVDIPLNEFQKINVEQLNLKKDKMALVDYKSQQLENFKIIEQKRKESIIFNDKLIYKTKNLEESKKKLEGLFEQESKKKDQLKELMKKNEQSIVEVKENRTKYLQQIQDIDNEIEQKQKDLVKQEKVYKEQSQIQANEKKKIGVLQQQLNEKESEFQLARENQANELESIKIQLASLQAEGKKILKKDKEMVNNQTMKVRKLAELQDKMLEQQKKKLDVMVLKKLIMEKAQQTAQENYQHYRDKIDYKYVPVQMNSYNQQFSKDPNDLLLSNPNTDDFIQQKQYEENQQQLDQMQKYPAVNQYQEQQGLHGYRFNQQQNQLQSQIKEIKDEQQKQKEMLEKQKEDTLEKENKLYQSQLEDKDLLLQKYLQTGQIGQPQQQSWPKVGLINQFTNPQLTSQQQQQLSQQQQDAQKQTQSMSQEQKDALEAKKKKIKELLLRKKQLMEEMLKQQKQKQQDQQQYQQFQQQQQQQQPQQPQQQQQQPQQQVAPK